VLNSSRRVNLGKYQKLLLHRQAVTVMAVNERALVCGETDATVELLCVVHALRPASPLQLRTPRTNLLLSTNPCVRSLRQ
jgi:flagellar biogenesis protein FliO